MSNTTLQFVYAPGGVLTDPDSNSVVFSDPTGQIACLRLDNGAAVSPPVVGAAFTRVSTGIYQYSIIDPASLVSSTNNQWVKIAAADVAGWFGLNGSAVAVTREQHLASWPTDTFVAPTTAPAQP